MALNRETLARAESLDESDRVVLDMDSSESPVHGQQEGSAYNGHFESVCYHPLFLFNSHGDCLAEAASRKRAQCDDWDELLQPEIDFQQEQGKEIAFRADAAPFAKPEILRDPGKAVAFSMPFVYQPTKTWSGRLPTILFRPPGRPAQPLVRYRLPLSAESWSKPRRIVAKVEHHQGELFRESAFIVTNMSLPSRSVGRFYKKRGTAGAVDQGRQAGNNLDAAFLSSFLGDEVRLQLMYSPTIWATFGGDWGYHGGSELVADEPATPL